MIVSNSFLSQALDSLLTFNPICIYAETTLDDLLERLYSTGFHRWPVINAERKVIGIVSAQDIVKFALEYRPASEGNEPGHPGFQIEASHFMRDAVSTVEATATPHEALAVLLEGGHNSVPVTRGGKLWGMITASDYVREFAYSSHPIRQDPICEIFNPAPLLIAGGDTIDEVRQQLQEEREDYAVVMEGDCPLGVVSARDLRSQKCRAIARSLFEGTPAAPARAIDIIRTSQVVSPKINLGTAATALFESQAQALMVCSRANELSGLITQEHILRRLLQDEPATVA